MVRVDPAHAEQRGRPSHQSSRPELTAPHVSCSLTALAPQLATRKNLTFIQLSNNQLTGRLDRTCPLTNTTLLAQFTVGNNLLSGSVPACLVNAPNMIELKAGMNNLTGTLPAIPASSLLTTLDLGYAVGIPSDSLCTSCSAQRFKQEGGKRACVPSSLL